MEISKMEIEKSQQNSSFYDDKIIQVFDKTIQYLYEI